MPRRKKGNPVHGWLVLDKPLGLTSTQCVGKVRRLFNAQKVGHGGTLDPLATGVLPIAFGEATKTVPYTMDAIKTYEFAITWGQHRDTLDAEGEVLETSDNRPAANDIEKALSAFVGTIDQVPPKYSALKIDGKRAYDLARAGVDVEMKTRQVIIHDLTQVSSGENEAAFRVTCGKGTYVRSLARDIAYALGTVGYVSFLRRTQVSPFDIGSSFSLDALEELCHRGRVLESLLPVETPLDDIPVVELDPEGASDLKHGRSARSTSFQNSPDADEQSVQVLAKFEGKALAICNVADGRLVPKRVFNL